jgi:hypothetical protein
MIRIELFTDSTLKCGAYKANIRDRGLISREFCISSYQGSYGKCFKFTKENIPKLESFAVEGDTLFKSILEYLYKHDTCIICIEI